MGIVLTSITNFKEISQEIIIHRVEITQERAGPKYILKGHSPELWENSTVLGGERLVAWGDFKGTSNSRAKGSRGEQDTAGKIKCHRKS